jgi:hypothetical protein
MKKIALFLTGAFLSVSTFNAMAMTTDQMVVESKFDGNKTKVERNELPQEVIQSLEEGQYQDWEIQEAYRVEDDLTNEVHYELHLASSADAQMVRSVTFNESGEIISEQESDYGRTGEQGLEQETEPGMDHHGTEPQDETPGEQY